jgi:uncharacterized 2Fe-2S/4Fe-4S cluster protein (DUF4445 family)
MHNAYLKIEHVRILLKKNECIQLAVHLNFLNILVMNYRILNKLDLYKMYQAYFTLCSKPILKHIKINVYYSGIRTFLKR